MEANYFTILYGFCHTLTWISHGCTCVPHPEPLSDLPPHPIPQGHPSAPALSTLSHVLNLDWQSVSHMIIYTFQCYSLKSPHPHLCPQNPKDCSIHLCLFCCLASSGHSLFFSKGFSLSLNHRMWNFFSNLKLTLFWLHYSIIYIHSALQ